MPLRLTVFHELRAVQCPPPSVVAKIVPAPEYGSWPTAQPWVVSLNATPSRTVLCQDSCVLHESPHATGSNAETTITATSSLFMHPPPSPIAACRALVTVCPLRLCGRRAWG